MRKMQSRKIVQKKERKVEMETFNCLTDLERRVQKMISFIFPFSESKSRVVEIFIRITTKEFGLTSFL